MGNQIWWTFNAKPYYLSDVIIQAKAPLGTKYGNAIRVGFDRSDHYATTGAIPVRESIISIKDPLGIYRHTVMKPGDYTASKRHTFYIFSK